MGISKRKIDATLQDQVTPTVIAKFSLVTEQTTIATAAEIGDTEIEVMDATGIIIGRYVSIFSAPDTRVYLGNVIDVDSNILTLDTPLDFAFPVGSYLDSGSTNMAVDGSSEPKTFGLRGTGVVPGVSLSFDLTKLKIICLTNSAVDLSRFANITSLPKGIVIRKRDGFYNNIFNIKNNADIDNIMEWNSRSALNPAQGQDGFNAQIVFAGQNELGVAVRLKVGQDLEVIIQDNLSGVAITKLEMIAEGHIVD